MKRFWRHRDTVETRPPPSSAHGDLQSTSSQSTLVADKPVRLFSSSQSQTSFSETVRTSSSQATLVGETLPEISDYSPARYRSLPGWIALEESLAMLSQSETQLPESVARVSRTQNKAPPTQTRRDLYYSKCGTRDCPVHYKCASRRYTQTFSAVDKPDWQPLSSPPYRPQSLSEGISMLRAADTRYGALELARFSRQFKRYICGGRMLGTCRWGCSHRFATAEELGRHWTSVSGMDCLRPLLECHSVAAYEQIHSMHVLVRHQVLRSPFFAKLPRHYSYASQHAYDLKCHAAKWKTKLRTFDNEPQKYDCPYPECSSTGERGFESDGSLRQHMRRCHKPRMAPRSPDSDDDWVWTGAGTRRRKEWDSWRLAI